MSILMRLWLSSVAFMVYAFTNAMYSPVATLGSGQAAGGQLLRSDGAYLQSVYTMTAWKTGFAIITALFLFALLIIWIGPIVRGIRALNDNSSLPIIMMLGLASGLLFFPDSARAYYDQKDFTEAYTILPNETAIIVPDVGNNADTQVQMDSEAYLKSKQVAAKRVVIPHAKLSGTGSFYDYYVPSARLFIVDRATFSHEWVGKGRGSNATVDEAFPCQSKEGLDITVGVSLGASVKEENAAKYLYNFGVASLDPKLNRADAQVIFASVYYSRKVADVMNDVGRKKVQTLVCGEISSRTFDNANADANKIMENVQKNANEYFSSVGITLNFIGWADTFSFAESVQKAVNDRYIVDKLGSSLTVLNAIANLKVQEGLGSGLDKHGLPIVVTPDMLNILSGLAVKSPSPIVGMSAPAGK